MKEITPTYKGLLTGILMVLSSLLIYFFNGGFGSGLQYIGYIIYTLGLVWTFMSYDKSTGNEGRRFKDFFSAGFRCFIVVTLVMVVFTALFIYLHPEMKKEIGENAKIVLSKDPNKTPAEVESGVAFQQKMFLPGFLIITVMGYLFIGALVSLILSGFYSQRELAKQG